MTLVDELIKNKKLRKEYLTTKNTLNCLYFLLTNASVTPDDGFCNTELF